MCHLFAELQDDREKCCEEEGGESMCPELCVLEELEMSSAAAEMGRAIQGIGKSLHL